MDSISNNQNVINRNNNIQAASNQGKVGQAHGHHKGHHHHKVEAQDTLDISQQGQEALKSSSDDTQNKSSLNPLDDLVKSGVLTDVQKNSILTAFHTARQNNFSGTGTYNSKPTNPIEGLVKAGTITEDQRKAIQSAFEASRQARFSSENSQNDVGASPVDTSVNKE